MHTQVDSTEADADVISRWLREYLAELLELPSDEIRDEQSFARFGLDSVASIAMAGDLSDWVGCEVDVTLVYDYPTISALSEYLAANLDVQRRLRERRAVRAVSVHEATS